MNVPGLVYRAYNDFLRPSRLGDWRIFLEQVMALGYRPTRISDLWEQIRCGRRLPPRVLILRHDIDTDCATARAMWQVERSLSVTGSYYFRLRTVDVAFMRELAKGGADVGYHYEEVATVGKRRHCTRRDLVLALLPEIQAEFRRNLESLRKRAGLPMRTAAAHGDWLNRRLGVYSWEILRDQGFRRELGIDLEAYDEAILNHVSSRHIDQGYPRYWHPSHPLDACRSGESVVYVTVHPRQWRANVRVNLCENVHRFAEEVRYWIADGRR